MRCAVPPTPAAGNIQVCGSNDFNGVILACGIAGAAMAFLVALVYMLGEFFNNPRMLMWAKTEALQVFASIAIVLVILFVLATVCTIRVGELNYMLGVNYPAIYSSLEHRQWNLYEGAIAYTEYLGTASIANMASLRYAMAAYEVRTTYTKYQCDSICIYSLSSTTISKFTGDSARLALMNNLLSAATVAQLGIITQYFILLYISKGLFIEFLPIAIIIRSIPFMRNFGGALIAIIISLYILYPGMMVVDAYITPSLAKGFQGASEPPYITLRTGYGPAAECGNVQAAFGEYTTGGGVTYYVGCDGTAPQNEITIKKVGIGEGIMNTIEPLDQFAYPATSELIKFNSLIFIVSVFLPAFNIIVIAALARELSRFLGEEADVSRLGQMI
jgi:ABC-type multidrug transport system fused ATPase/permease subunit